MIELTNDEILALSYFLYVNCRIEYTSDDMITVEELDGILNKHFIKGQILVTYTFNVAYEYHYKTLVGMYLYKEFIK